MAALAAGKHVLCEKPLANTLDEAREMLEAARDAGIVEHGQLQLPAGAGRPARRSSSSRTGGWARSGTGGRSTSRTGSTTRSSRSSGACRRSWPAPARSATSAPTSSTWRTSWSDRSRGRRAPCRPSSRSDRWRRRAARRALRDRRNGDRGGDGRRRHDLPGPLRERRDRHLRGDAPRARPPQPQLVRDQRLERQRLLRPGADERAPGLLHRRSRRAAGLPHDQRHRAGPPLQGGWWPAGHIIGYEHTFVHAIKDLLDGISSGKSPAPSFADGYRCQAVLDAVERSADSRTWTTPEP